jgi:hypothetical protein
VGVRACVRDHAERVDIIAVSVCRWRLDQSSPRNLFRQHQTHPPHITTATTLTNQILFHHLHNVNRYYYKVSLVDLSTAELRSLIARVRAAGEKHLGSSLTTAIPESVCDHPAVRAEIDRCKASFALGASRSAGSTHTIVDEASVTSSSARGEGTVAHAAVAADAVHTRAVDDSDSAASAVTPGRSSSVANDGSSCAEGRIGDVHSGDGASVSGISNVSGTFIAKGTGGGGSSNTDAMSGSNRHGGLTHLEQQASLVGNMQKFQLLGPKFCYVEFGAGRGKLLHFVYRAVGEGVEVNFALTILWAVTVFLALPSI